MQIVIDIPNSLYKVIQECKVIEGDNEGNIENVLVRAVENGVVLPRGHGRLIDADWLEDNCDWYYTDDADSVSCYKVRDIENAPTIIEADKAESEDKNDC